MKNITLGTICSYNYLPIFGYGQTIHVISQDNSGCVVKSVESSKTYNIPTSHIRFDMFDFSKDKSKVVILPD